MLPIHDFCTSFIPVEVFSKNVYWLNDPYCNNLGGWGFNIFSLGEVFIKKQTIFGYKSKRQQSTKKDKINQSFVYHLCIYLLV